MNGLRRWNLGNVDVPYFTSLTPKSSTTAVYRLIMTRFRLSRLPDHVTLIDRISDNVLWNSDSQTIMEEEWLLDLHGKLWKQESLWSTLFHTVEVTRAHYSELQTHLNQRATRKHTRPTMLSPWNLMFSKISFPTSHPLLASIIPTPMAKIFPLWMTMVIPRWMTKMIRMLTCTPTSFLSSSTPPARCLPRNFPRRVRDYVRHSGR